MQYRIILYTADKDQNGISFENKTRKGYTYTIVHNNRYGQIAKIRRKTHNAKKTLFHQYIETIL